MDPPAPCSPVTMDIIDLSPPSDPEMPLWVPEHETSDGAEDGDRQRSVIISAMAVTVTSTP